VKIQESCDNSNFAGGESFASVALVVQDVNSVNYVVGCEVDSKIRGGRLDSGEREGSSGGQVNPIVSTNSWRTMEGK
jgi:hypothetical protein